jgi:homotetrameric cytidine deaminase/tRNA-Thr(GGU) m(6)t(6)A37 methyltransferase TsaA
MTDEEKAILITAASRVRENAHAPYSHFRVGAALRANSGRIFTGCNVENSTFGLTLCAERVAVFKALSEGERRFEAVAVVADTERLTPPCGACRQILWEFCGDAEVVLANLSAQVVTRRMSDLLPDAFDSSFLSPSGNSESNRAHKPRIAVSRFSMQPIGYVRSPYTDAREIPRGLGAKHKAEGVLEIRQELEPGLTDIEGFSHLFVIWAFDRSEGFELLGIPPSDNRPHGVFATRSPKRPNPIGLTVVEFRRREGPRLHVGGVDMLDKTPILDIKPYLSSVSEEQLKRGWLAEAEARRQP